MKRSIRKGVGFGVTSGIITTLGLMVGLYSTTKIKSVVAGGILVIAIADALSDALGIHMAEEYSLSKKCQSIWAATISTFIFKFFTALTFLVPLVFLELKPAVIIGVIWGLLLLVLFNYKLAKQKNAKPLPIILEHLLIAIVVVIITYYLGLLVGFIF